MKRDKKKEGQEEHLLVIRFSAMGDVAIVSHAVEAFIRDNPDKKVTILTRPRFQPFFRGLDGVSFVTPDLKGRHRGVVGMIRLWRDIASHGITHVADLHNVLRSKLLRKLLRASGCRVAVIDKGRRDKRALTRSRFKFKVPLKTSLERYRTTILRLGFRVGKPEPRVQTAKNLPGYILDLTGGKTGPWIGIAPFAMHKGKVYPKEQAIELVELLHESYDNIFIFGGGAKEKKFGDKLADRFPGVHSVIGQLDLSEELDLISNLDVMVSMDSSAMHMSSLEGTPVVSVWGATHPYAGFFGFGQNPDDTIQIDLACRPCSIYGRKPCRYGDHHCMTLIDPQLIADQIGRVLERNGKVNPEDN